MSIRASEPSLGTALPERHACGRHEQRLVPATGVSGYYGVIGRRARRGPTGSARVRLRAVLVGEGSAAPQPWRACGAPTSSLRLRWPLPVEVGQETIWRG